MSLFDPMRGFSGWSLLGGFNTTPGAIGPYMPPTDAVRNISNNIGGLNLGLGNTQTSRGFLDSIGGLGGLTGLMQGAGALWNAYNGMKAMEMAQDQFGFQRRLANRNIANQAKIINNTYDNAAQVAAGMIGSKDANGNYGFTDQAVVDRYAANARKKHVDGSAI